MTGLTKVAGSGQQAETKNVMMKQASCFQLVEMTVLFGRDGSVTGLRDPTDGSSTQIQWIPYTCRGPNDFSVISLAWWTKVISQTHLRTCAV